MAVTKDMEIKGINCPYHKIVDCNVKTGFVGVSHYVNKEAAAERGNMMGGRDTIEVDFPNDIESPLAYAYEQLKVSVIEEEVETNWYADSVDEI